MEHDELNRLNAARGCVVGLMLTFAAAFLLMGLGLWITQ